MTTETPSGMQLLVLAEAAYAAKNYEETIRQARAALDAGLDLGAHESERGIYEPRSETSSCELLIGVAMHDSGASDASIEHLDKAVELDREDSRPWGNRGHVRRERGELALAVEDLSKSLELRPSYVFARFRRAQCFVDLGRPAEAEADLEEILRAHPEDAAPRALWQELRTRRGAPSDITALPAPRDGWGLLQRAAFFAQNGELARSLADYDAAFAGGGLIIIRAYRGQVHEQLGNLALAEADYEAYLETDPNNAAILAGLARVKAAIQP